MNYDKNNIFAKILRGEIPCKKVYENEYVLSFYDINPQRKIHVLVISKGEYIGCFGLTEPDSGSDASTMKTNAKLVNGDYILNGSKTWITNSPIAELVSIDSFTDTKLTFHNLSSSNKSNNNFGVPANLESSSLIMSLNFLCLASFISLSSAGLCLVVLAYPSSTYSSTIS